MKTDIEIMDDIYLALKSTALAESVNGGIFKGERDLGSLKEDITINILANNITELQAAFVNVNIYVKDINVKGQYRENDKRLRELSRLAWDTFKIIIGENYRVTMDSQRIVTDSGAENVHEHYINNKLKYQHYNYE